MQTNIDVNDVVENLTQEVAKYIRENAILKAQVKALIEEVETLKEFQDLDDSKES